MTLHSLSLPTLCVNDCTSIQIFYVGELYILFKERSLFFTCKTIHVRFSFCPPFTFSNFPTFASFKIFFFFLLLHSVTRFAFVNICVIQVFLTKHFMQGYFQVFFSFFLAIRKKTSSPIITNNFFLLPDHVTWVSLRCCFFFFSILFDKCSSRTSKMCFYVVPNIFGKMP